MKEGKRELNNLMIHTFKIVHIDLCKFFLMFYRTFYLHTCIFNFLIIFKPIVYKTVYIVYTYSVGWIVKDKLLCIYK